MTDEPCHDGKKGKEQVETSDSCEYSIKVFSQGEDVTQEVQKKIRQRREAVRLAERRLAEPQRTGDVGRNTASPTKADPDTLMELAHRIHEKEKAGEDVANPRMRRVNLKAKVIDEDGS